MSFYSEYIFRMPAGTPDLDYGSLTAFLVHKCGVTSTRELLDSSYAWIGNTIRLRWAGPGCNKDAVLPPAIGFFLYGLLIARIMPGSVYFPETDDTHQATTQWLSKIIADNAIGSGAYRIRRRKADGPGPAGPRGRAGLLVIDGDRDRPVEGYTYETGDIAELHASRARQAGETRRASEELAAETQRRQELKTWTHPEFGPVYAIEDDPGHGYHWRAVDGSFYDTLGYIRDTRIGPDMQPYHASPYPAPHKVPVFAAFAGGAEHRQDFLGLFDELSGALAAISNRHLAGTGVTC